MQEQIQELIKKWERLQRDTEDSAKKMKAYGNEAGYKEFMHQSFGYAECIADLKTLIK